MTIFFSHLDQAQGKQEQKEAKLRATSEGEEELKKLNGELQEKLENVLTVIGQVIGQMSDGKKKNKCNNKFDKIKKFAAIAKNDNEKIQEFSAKNYEVLSKVLQFAKEFQAELCNVQQHIETLKSFKKAYESNKVLKDYLLEENLKDFNLV